MSTRLHFKECSPRSEARGGRLPLAVVKAQFVGRERLPARVVWTVRELVKASGWPWWRVKNVIAWRWQRGLALPEVDGVVR